MTTKHENTKGGGWIPQEDLAALQGIDYLHMYCERMLGTGKQIGSSMYFRCPWGEHQKLHLDVHEYRGKGNAHCWACDKRGTVFDVAAAVQKKDLKENFPEIVRHVAKVVGYQLHEGAAAPRRKRGSAGWVGCDPARFRKKEVDTAEDEEIQFLPKFEEQVAWESVENARKNPEYLRYSAIELGLPLGILQMHTEECRADSGMIGLTQAGRLSYIYTVRDAEGRMRVVMTKQRGGRGDKFRFLCGKGAHKQVLFGAEAIGSSRYVIITEGESDALAARASLWKWAGEALKNGDVDSNFATEDIPVVVGKPDAGTFKPIWARPLRGKDVILCVDNDSAGIQGAVKTCEILRRCGVGNIYTWSAPEGCKDVRDAYKRHAGASEELINEIFENLTIL